MSAELLRQLSDLNRRLERIERIEKGGGSGTAFPSSPPTNLRWFRTDLGWWCYYDGSQWLTENEYTCVMVPSEDNAYFAASFAAAGGTRATLRLGQLRRDYKIYITRIEFLFYVATTNDGSNFWTFTVRDSTTASIAGNSTVADAANANLAKSFLAGGGITQPGAARDYLYMDIAPTGTPGAFFPRNPVAFYRLVVT